MNAPILAVPIRTAAKMIGFDREQVSDMCDRGELPYVPCRTKDGKPSRIHRRVLVSGLQAWCERNAVRSKEDLKLFVDGRRNPKKTKSSKE